MRAIKLPKFDINNIKILVAKIISIHVDLRFLLNIKDTLHDIGSLELPVRHFHIIFLVRDKKHAIYHTDGVPLLKLWSLFEKL